MALLGTVKRVSIQMGLYRPARWISRQLRRDELRGFTKDVELYRTLIPAGALCFDIGANIGEKSDALLEAGHRVVSFEPNPDVLPELLARCGRSTRWSVVHAALGSGPAIAMLHAMESHGSSSLDENWVRGRRQVAKYHVPVVTLDSAIRCFGTPFYCKVDVEGWELEVFLGLSQPIPLISFEFHLQERDVKKTLACLQRLGQFGQSRINLTSAEGSTFHLENWMSIQEFLSWFPGNLSETLPGYHYGDIFVMNDSVQQQHAGDGIATRC